jgi:hypothetical protein
MKKALTEMTNIELRQYLSENRNDVTAFSQALEMLLSRENIVHLHYINRAC